MEKPRIGQELLDVPMGDMIRQMAFAIADAQMRLDENSIDVAQMMGGLETITETIGGEEVVTFKDSRVFFGKEKMMLSSAIEIYNTTDDNAERGEILKKLTATNSEDKGDSEITNLVIVTVQAPGVDGAVFDQTNTEENSSKIYKYSNDYYKYNSSSESYYKIVTPKKLIGADVEITIPQRLSMLELGFSPTFYQFVDTIIEVKISIKYSKSGSDSGSTSERKKSGGVKFRWRKGRVDYNINTTQVNASYSNKYSYSAEGSSLLRTKLVPIPPPTILEERIQQQMEIARQENVATTP